MGSFLIVYHPLVVEKDIPRLDRTMTRRIRSAIESKLTARPELYGAPLRATLKQFWKLRVGDWRVVYEVKKNTVRVLVIAHRADAYEIAGKRS